MMGFGLPDDNLHAPNEKFHLKNFELGIISLIRFYGGGGKLSRPHPAPGATTEGFVLAGGQSTRMGVDKALVHLRGRPLVEHALEILRGAGLAASIAGARSTLSAFAAVVEDVEAGKGPLGGICAALASTSAQRAVFVPVDLPLLPSSLVAYLVRHAEITGRAVTLASVAGLPRHFLRSSTERLYPGSRPNSAPGA